MSMQPLKQGLKAMSLGVCDQGGSEGSVADVHGRVPCRGLGAEYLQGVGAE